MPAEAQIWQKKYTEFIQQWGLLSEAIKGSAIDPVTIDYSWSTEDTLESAVRGIERE